ncbi:hypothetical protein [Rubripirellula reticaptiva]|uniref:Uncharacterized protein n=1 Tax=Rubripirellula reticaptiva TaxID=2528013 RepID=A0A5C6F8G7_9BACT|nr:hypothetical protein [Rubripirellula reticaptiva]TWU58043.1 hypothetical protein Poly59_09520 [Rubripirellula reticaptiva]
MDHDSEAPIEARLVKQSPNSADYHIPETKFLDNKWAVIAILFAVTGFLGIPLLWMNQSFNSAERIFWAVVVTIYTVLLIGGAVAVCMWSYRQIMGV